MKNPFKMFIKYLHTVGGVNDPRWQQPLEQMSIVELYQLEGQAEHNRWFHSKNVAIAFMFAILLLGGPAMALRSSQLTSSDIVFVVGIGVGSAALAAIGIMIAIEIVAFNAGKIMAIESILKTRTERTSGA